MTVVGKLGLQEYLLRNNIDEKIAEQLTQEHYFIDQLDSKIIQLKVNDLEICQECLLPQFISKRIKELKEL